ncbi:MAG: glycosyl hydrolase [Planctomycetota bacterium]
MYSDVGFEPRNVGDVDVVYHEGKFHLFHLVLPNHDYIAHAVSDDGLNWRRVENALFIGNPGSWDDDALWTMNVSGDPDKPGCWRMFYTGLSRRERGRVQRIGLAVSDDLIHWKKVNDGVYPIDVARGGETFYESSLHEGRKWVSFRDPLFFCDGGKRWLLVSGRVKHGPVIRRGCVSLVEEVERDKWEFRPPLYHPRRYDDVEVPGLFKLGGNYFLLGSIREDVKVRYWYSETLQGPWRNYFDNVLLPQGNYAARTCVYPLEAQEVDDDGRLRGESPSTNDVCDLDGCGRLVFNFYFTGSSPAASKWGQARNLMPPPKRLVTHEDGRLLLKSFDGFDRAVRRQLHASDLGPLRPISGNPDSRVGSNEIDCWFGSDAGFETFLLQGAHRDFRLRGKLSLEGRGKCGFVFRFDEPTTSGYYLSLDLQKGLAQLRSWKSNYHETPGMTDAGPGTEPGVGHAGPAVSLDEGLGENAFNFRAIQSGNFLTNRTGPWDFELLAYGKYLEFSVDGYVRLSLVDDTFRDGRLGFYAETAQIRVEHLELDHLYPPHDEAAALTP